MMSFDHLICTRLSCNRSFEKKNKNNSFEIQTRQLHFIYSFVRRLKRGKSSIACAITGFVLMLSEKYPYFDNARFSSKVPSLVNISPEKGKKEVRNCVFQNYTIKLQTQRELMIAKSSLLFICLYFISLLQQINYSLFLQKIII